MFEARQTASKRGFVAVRPTVVLLQNFTRGCDMGGHYGSVQVRSEDHVAVKAVAEQVAIAMKIRLLIGPAIDGWIGLYPEGNGQDEKVGMEVARLTDAYVLHLLVHDDDIFAYWLFHRRQLVDSYWSAPGYFGDGNREIEERMAGNPEVFRPLIQDSVGRLGALLARGDSKPVFEFERLAEFAKLLRISNAVQAYEYLKGEDHGRVKGWRQFEEIPVARVDGERSKARKEKAEVRAAIQKLRSSGLLILRDERREQIAYGCAAANGFVVAWPDHRKHTVEFAMYGAPWSNGQTISLRTPEHVTGLASDSTGRRIAISAGDRVQVRDFVSGEWKHAADIPERDLAIGVAISPDGKRVAHASRREFVVSDIAGSSSPLVFPAQSHRHAAFHPSGDWVAVAGNTLGLIAVNDDPHWTDLFIGGRSTLAVGVELLIRSKMKNIDLSAMQKQQRARIDSSIEMLRKMNKRSMKGEFSDEKLESMRLDMEKQMGEFTARLMALKEGRMPPSPPQANEPVLCTGFSRDGRWLWCSTNSGLRVYEWSHVPRMAGANMPSPVWKFDVPRDDSAHFPSHIHAIVEEVEAPALIFACGSQILRMDLSSGDTRELIRVPGNAIVYQLAISVEGNSLGAAMRDFQLSSASRSDRNLRKYWDIWSLPRLRGP